MNEAEASKSNDSSLTIKRLMAWTVGVAFALTVAKFLNAQRVQALNLVTLWGDPHESGLSTADYLISRWAWLR